MNVPLNIDWQQILLHLLNFVILFGILYFFLYKPVKDFMEKREAEYRQQHEDAKNALEEADRIKTEYEGKIAGAEEEISAMKSEAGAKNAEERTRMLEQAKADAAGIVEAAKKRGEMEHDKIIAEAQKEIADIVTTATEKIVLSADVSKSYDEFLKSAEGNMKNE
ncbi:MAG: ATP synthase F0 subunit B [Lachnospiraceae bacterium]|nr:ATP synthase F0 subunit B [Lachnospiraceae bacterium]